MSLFATIPGGPGFPAGCGIVPTVDAQDPLGPIPDANRGASADVCPPIDGCRSAVVDVLDTRTWSGCSVSRDLIVTLGRRRTRNPNGPPPVDDLEGQFVLPRLTAFIQWGIGGSANEEAEVDWQHGTQLSIGAQNVIVQARYEVITPDGGTFDPCDLPLYTVNAGVSRGTVAVNSNPARLTRVVQVPTPGDKVRISVPNFAISFTTLVLGEGVGALVEQVAFGTAYRTQHTYGSPTANVDQYNVENAIPLWNGAEFLDVTNTNDEGPLTAFVIFGLAL